MDESEDNVKDVDVKKNDFTSHNKKPKKRSLVERELETNLTSRVTSPVNTGGGASLSRYGRARRLKQETESIDGKKIVLEVLKSPLSEKSPVLVTSPVYKMHASNSPIRSESPKKAIIEETYLNNQIESIFQENISLSRFGAEEIVTTSPAKKFPKVYIRKDLIQKREQEETIMLIKNMFSPVKSASKSSNSHLNSVLDRSSEKFSLNSPKSLNGYLDNSSVVKMLDFDSNKKKKKEHKDSKVLSKSDLFELEAKCPYQVGDLAWARMGTYPFWPCIVTRDPCTGMFVKNKLFGRVEHDIVHVTFFGDNGRRSWIVDNMLRQFHGQVEFELTREKFTPEDKKKDPKLYAAFFVSEKKIPMWNTSIEEAEILLREPKRLRIDILNDMLQNPRSMKTTPKQPKSGKVTRTDSDVSLSESLYDSLFSEDDGKIEDTDRSRNKSRNKSLDVSQVVTACLDNMAAKTGITRIQRQSHMDRWLQKAKSKTPEKTQAPNPLPHIVEKESKVNISKKKKRILPTQSLRTRYSLRNSPHESHHNLYPFHNEHDYSRYQNEENNAAGTNEIGLTKEGSNRNENYGLKTKESEIGIGVIVKVETLSDKPKVKEQDIDIKTKIGNDNSVVPKQENFCEDDPDALNADNVADLTDKNPQDKTGESNLNDSAMDVDTPTEYLSVKQEIEGDETDMDTENNDAVQDEEDNFDNEVNNDVLDTDSDTLDDLSVQDESDHFKNLTNDETDSIDQGLFDIGTKMIEDATNNMGHKNNPDISANVVKKAIQNVVNNKKDNVIVEKALDVNKKVDDNVINVNNKNIFLNMLTSIVTAIESKGEELSDSRTDIDMAGPSNISTGQVENSIENNVNISEETTENHVITNEENNKDAVDSSINSKKNETIQEPIFLFNTDNTNQSIRDIISVTNDIVSNNETDIDSVSMEPKERESSIRDSIDSSYSEVLPYSPLSTCDKLDQDDLDDQMIDQQEEQNDLININNENDKDWTLHTYVEPKLDSTPVKKKTSINDESQTILVNGFHDPTNITSKIVNKFDKKNVTNPFENSLISTNKHNLDDKTSVNRTKINSKPEKKTEESFQDPKFQKYLQLKQDTVMDEHPELNEDEIIAYLYKTWLYEENTKSDAKKADDIEQSGLVKGLDKERPRKKLSITLKRVDRGYLIKKKVRVETDTISLSSENSEISSQRSTRSRRLRYCHDNVRESSKNDCEAKRCDELSLDTASIDSRESEYSMSKRFGSNYSPLETAKDKIDDKSPDRLDEELEIASVSSEDIGTPIFRRGSRCRRLNSTVEENIQDIAPDNKYDSKTDPDIISIKSEDTETSLTKWLKSSNKVARQNKRLDNERDADIISINSEDVEMFSIDKFHCPSKVGTESSSKKPERKYQDDRDIEIVSVNSEESDSFFTATKRRYKRIQFPSQIVKENKSLEISIRGNYNNNRDIETESINSESSELPLSTIMITESKDPEDFDIPLSKRILRQKECETKAPECLEKKIKVEKEVDTISIHSEDSDMPLSVRKQRLKTDKKQVKDFDDPEFVKYIELKQDALIDENPQLSQEDIVAYLYKTWIYEENAKSDLKKTDDIEQSNLVKGLNQDVPQPKRIRKKHKVEKENHDDLDRLQTCRLSDKPKRKIIKPYYNEDYSDLDDELELFDIFKKDNKKIRSVPKPIVETVKVKNEMIDVNVNADVKEKVETNGNEEIKENAQLNVETETPVEINDEMYVIEDEIDEVEGYFNDLTRPKPNIFKGLIREKVCDICEDVGNLVKCKGCHSMFHVDCVNKVVEIVEEATPTRGRKKKKKLGRKPKGSEDDSHSDDKSQDVSNENVSIEDIIEPQVYTVDAESFETQLTIKMKEILGDIDTVQYDSSSDDGLDWHDTKPGKCEIVNIKPKKKTNLDYSDFKCNNCQKNDKPICFVCKSFVSKNMVKHRQRCHVTHCHKHYHLECLDHWPQTQFNGGEPSRNNKKIDEHFEAVTCPRHVCHTCVSDDPRGCKTRFSGDKLARCVRCPATYHSFTKCLPAGTQILTGSQIICPRHYEHRPGKVPCHVNTGWCFICALGGTLICCEYCPTSFHAECLNIKPPEGGYMCEDCETGRLPLYGEMVWVKLGHYRWWPGIILNPCEIPVNIMAVKHSLGEFVVRFFGQYDHYWVNRGRVFPFQEGDSGRVSSQKSKIDADFTTAMNHARRAFEILKTAQPNEEESLDIALSLMPPHYVKLKVNKPCGSLVGRRLEDPESSLTQCECDPGVGPPLPPGADYVPGDDDPCGPYSHCLNRMLLTECGPTCRAGDRCSNRAFEKRRYPKLVPYRTPHRGWGLKTLENIRAGQFVIEYVGEVLDEAEFQRRMKRKHEMRDENYYFLTLDKERMIDAGPKGNLARFMNHCCEPNCETQKWTVLGDVRVGLFALYDIPANSEVTFNYNLECAGIEKKRCLCGAKRCSGYMGAKPKQDESQAKKSKLPTKRTYKKRKNVEISPVTTKTKPAKRVGRPPKPKELTEIEKDLMIIRNATNSISTDEVRPSSKDSEIDPKSLKRKFDNASVEVHESKESPTAKKQKLDEVGD